jgi:hypothetical protein
MLARHALHVFCLCVQFSFDAAVAFLHCREKVQLQRVLKASKKQAKRNGGLLPDAFEGAHHEL